jgi:hypothetical protein
MARRADDTVDPRLEEFVEVLAQALALDYQRQIVEAEKKVSPAAPQGAASNSAARSKR